MKKNILKYWLMAIMWLAYTLPVLAQFDEEPPIDDDPNPAPIDNWILILILAGMAIGAYLIIRHTKKQLLNVN